MLIVELESTGDSDTDFQLLGLLLNENEQLFKGAEATLFFLGASENPSDFRYGDLRMFSEIAETTRSIRADTGALLSSVTAWLKGVSVFDRVVARDNLDILKPESRLVDDNSAVSLLTRVRNAVARGDPCTAAMFLTHCRRTLRADGGLLALDMEGELRAVQVLLDLDVQFFRQQSSIQAQRLIRRGLVDDLTEFIGSQEVSLDSCISANPGLREILSARRDFIHVGKEYSRRMANQAEKSLRVDTFLWLAVYFLRLSVNYLQINDSAASLCAAVRALENYLSLVLIHEEAGHLDDYGLRISRSDVKDGVGAAWGIFANEVASDLRQRRPQLVTDIERTIRLRNRSALAHGTQRISLEEAKQFTQAIRSLVREAEATKFGSPDQFEELWNRTEPLVKTDLLNSTVQRALENSFKVL